ncbi:MAG: hypothetical protein LBM06_07075 [Prevotellaceae bacterium]|nr:hypothetical protein [Prevotellaceae bacterium]
MAPFTSSVLGATVMVFALNDSLSKSEIALKRTVIAFFLLNAVNAVFIYLYEFLPEWYVPLSPLGFLAFVCYIIAFYGIICMLTRLDEAERFSPMHLIAPLLMTAVLGGLQLAMPTDIGVKFITNHEAEIPAPYLFYKHFFLLHRLLELFFILGYTLAMGFRLHKYHRKAKSSDSLIVNADYWITRMFIFAICTLASSAIFISLPRKDFGTSLWTLLAVFSILALHSELVYHVLMRKQRPYLLNAQQPVRRQYRGELSRRRLENYFRHKKPYLDSSFKITDLVEVMDVNRTIVSSFINKTYGMNFNRFVNRWRLEEVTFLKGLAYNAGKRIDQLVKQAGFSDVKHYRRALNQQTAESEAALSVSEATADSKEEGGVDG